MQLSLLPNSRTFFSPWKSTPYPLAITRCSSLSYPWKCLCWTCPINGILHHVAFCSPFTRCHVFRVHLYGSWCQGLIPFYCWLMGTAWTRGNFICPFISWRVIGLLWILLREHLCISFYVDVCFLFLLSICLGVKLRSLHLIFLLSHDF